MSQEDVSKAMEMARSSIANIERGRQKISVETLFELAHVLRIEPAKLLPQVQAKPKKKPVSVRRILPQGTESEREFVKSILTRKGTDHDPKGELGETKTPGGPGSQGP